MSNIMKPHKLQKRIDDLVMGLDLDLEKNTRLRLGITKLLRLHKLLVEYELEEGLE